MSFQKVKLRTEMRALRKAFKGEQRLKAETQIISVLSELIDQTKRAEPQTWIGVYYPFDGEVDVSKLWKEETGQSRLSSLPLVFPLHHPKEKLKFILPQGWTDSSVLPQPIGPTIELDSISLLLIPGLAFCPKTGIRLGLGGGHYDRTLAFARENAWSGLAFGVAFSFQEYNELPREPWDLPLHGLITEMGLNMFTHNLP